MAWERMGLVRPERRGGRRVYSEDELRWLGCLQAFNRPGGISLQGVSALLKFVPCWAIRGQLAEETDGPCVPAEWPAGRCLDRVVRAYGGHAPAACRDCGIWRKHPRGEALVPRRHSSGAYAAAVRAVASPVAALRAGAVGAAHAGKESP
jgi:hypothetical protein